MMSGGIKNYDIGNLIPCPPIVYFIIKLSNQRTLNNIKEFIRLHYYIMKQFL